uniref:Uncharacterized protein n=1 Tax=Oryza brachyantha TaxID=4533 RepID=J3LNS2_ORYBR
MDDGAPIKELSQVANSPQSRKYSMHICWLSQRRSNHKPCLEMSVAWIGQTAHRCRLEILFSYSDFRVDQLE